MNTKTLIIAGTLGLAILLFTPRVVWATPAIGQKYDPYFKDAEKKNGLPAGLLSRMAKQESNYNVNATGASGEIGLMQIIPKWHPGVNPADPIASIYYVGRLMRDYFNTLGSWDKAIAAYNWGITNVRTKGIEQAPRSTLNYINSVLTDIGVK